VKPFYGICQVQRLIEDSFGIAAGLQRLTHRGVRLETLRSVRDYNIIEGDTIMVAVVPTREIYVWVNSGRQSTMCFVMEAWDTIADVKVRIESETGWPSQRQAIVYNHAEAADTLQLSDLIEENEYFLGVQFVVRVVLRAA
jgi:hypothetical protein